jgi:hypothetical protein
VTTGRTSRPWEPDGELIRCRTHKISFGKVEQCPDCEASPLLAPSDVDLSPPAGCVGSDEHERWHMERAKTWAAQASGILDKSIAVGEDCDPTTVAVKAEEVARKHRTEAANFTRQRERKAYISALRKERERIRKGWGGSN